MENFPIECCPLLSWQGWRVGKGTGVAVIFTVALHSRVYMLLSQPFSALLEKRMCWPVSMNSLEHLR